MNQKGGNQEEYMRAKVGLVLLAIILIIATYVIVQRSVSLSRMTDESGAIVIPIAFSQIAGANKLTKG